MLHEKAGGSPPASPKQIHIFNDDDAGLTSAAVALSCHAIKTFNLVLSNI
jgi:hypothetical protein